MAGEMSSDAATLIRSGWLLQVVRATTAWAVSVAMSTTATPTATTTRSFTLTRRSRPRWLTGPRCVLGFTGVLVHAVVLARRRIPTRAAVPASLSPDRR